MTPWPAAPPTRWADEPRQPVRTSAAGSHPPASGPSAPGRRCGQSPPYCWPPTHCHLREKKIRWDQVRHRLMQYLVVCLKKKMVSLASDAAFGNRATGSLIRELHLRATAETPRSHNSLSCNISSHSLLGNRSTQSSLSFDLVAIALSCRVASRLACPSGTLSLFFIF